MSAIQGPLTAPDYYWAAEEDPKSLATFLANRANDFGETMRNTFLWDRIRRNWRYYHNLFFEDDTSFSSREIRTLGEQGEYAGLSVNHHKNLLDHLVTLVTQNPPAYDARAVNTEIKSLQQAKLANSILDFYRIDRQIEAIYMEAVRHALILSAGYVKTVWDPSGGRELAADTERDFVFHEGDLKWSLPSLFDVYYDVTVRSGWQDHQWVAVREWENRWDLAARYPDFSDEIVSYEQDEASEINFRIGTIDFKKHKDRIPVLEFYHVRTDALPHGRYVKLLGDNVLLDTPMPYQDLPVDRIVPSTFLLTPFGYTPGYDLQGLQEAINQEYSAITTNHRSFGVQNIWSPTASNLSVRQILDGMNLVESDEEPKALNLTSTPPEIFQFLGVLERAGEYLSGVNSVARGQPEASLKSGRALALIDAKAVQYASGLIKAYTHLIEQNGTKTIRILRDFAMTERMITITGIHNRTYMKSFSGDDLHNVDRVTVESGNALSKTLAGRVDMADKLLEHNMLRNREEYFQVLQTGKLEVALEGENAQLSVVREENERLLDGGDHFALALDNHVLHIKEHAAQLNSTEIRTDPFASANILGAVMEHLSMLMDPMVQMLQATLGYDTAIPPIPGYQHQEERERGPEGAPAGPQRDPRAPPEPFSVMGPEAQAAQNPFVPGGATAGATA